MSKNIVLGLFIFAVFLTSCTMQLDQPTAKPAPTSTAPLTGELVPAGTNIPVSWSNLQLTGSLIYVGQKDTVDNVFLTIQKLDLVTGHISDIFVGPAQAWIYAVTVSPDHQQLIFSYADPNDKQSFGLPALYSMPANGSQPPKLLFAPATKEDQYFQPLWVQIDGKDYLYYSHATTQGPSKAGSKNLVLELYRMALPNGQPEKLASDAFWPAISPDGKRLVYVAIDEKGANTLISANPNGSNAKPIAATGAWIPHYIDAPIFLADNKTVLFSAISVTSTKSSLTWLDQLLGVTIASAHNVPSDWWSVPVDGGPVTQLTHLQTTALFASPLPNGQQLLSYSGSGLFAMNTDGTSLQMLTDLVGDVPSSLSWIP